MLLAHKPLVDSDVKKTVFSVNANLRPEDIELESWDTKIYLDRFEHWINSSTHNKVIGLENFSHKAYCAGVNEAIAVFVSRHAAKKRIRFGRAEFVGAKINSNAMQANWCLLEDDEIRVNDAVILSWPYAGNGHEIPEQDLLLKQCQHLDVPVMIDLAYFGISHGMTFDVSHHCITDVAVSLSKPLSVPLRLGMRFTRNYHDDNIQSLSDSKIYNRMAVKTGTELMKTFSHDWLIDKYLPLYQEVCAKLNLQSTPTITLALGNSVKHKEFFRNGYYRVCVTDELLQNI
jgi:hypothetical protein